MRFLALAVAVVVVGCSTSYVPQTRGRVAVVMDGGMWAYARDGEVHRHGFLGSGLQRAVRGNPRAEQAAQQYHDRQRDGLLVVLGGLVCSGVALGYAARDLDAETNRAPAALYVSLGCLLASIIVGPLYIVSAEPYRWDAINIFNDQPMLPGPGYSGLPKKQASLRFE